MFSLQWDKKIFVFCPLFMYFYFYYYYISLIVILPHPFLFPWQQFSSLYSSVRNQLHIRRLLLKLWTNFCIRLLLLLNQMSARRDLRDIVPGTLESKICSKSKSRILKALKFLLSLLWTQSNSMTSTLYLSLFLL